MFVLESGWNDIDQPTKAAIHMYAEVKVMSGGPVGRRLIDSAFAGWINNEPLPENVHGTYAGNHHQRTIFARNRDEASGPMHAFLPRDPKPDPVKPPLLDTARPRGGMGGESATLKKSRIRSRKALSVGEQWIVEAVDTPSGRMRMDHPAFGTRLVRYHYELDFRAYLSFWTHNTSAFGSPAKRVYACLHSFSWKMLGEWTIDSSDRVTEVIKGTTTITNHATHIPCKENHKDGCEVRFPRIRDVSAFDART